MFGALNRFISRLDSDSPSRDTDSPGTFGFQVLRNKNEHIPIEPWFDFIIGINGRQIVRLRTFHNSSSSDLIMFQDDPDSTLFATEVRNCAGSTVTLTLWSAKVKTRSTRSWHDGRAPTVLLRANKPAPFPSPSLRQATPSV